MGATRLKIIDLSSDGNQPLQNEDKSISLVFNGEIYNWKSIEKNLKKRHKFISQTDSEVLLHLYEEVGVECLLHLRGMFAFAIWDKRNRQLFLARDRLGKKPLKYFYNKDFFIFASELKAFIDHPNVPKEIDHNAINSFLNFGYVPSPLTGFTHIKKLPPAHYLIVKQSGDVTMKRYWNIDFLHTLSLSENEWRGQIEDKLIESVKLRLQSDVTLGLHLSGGIDSGLITAIASKQLKERLKTVSIGFENTQFSELKYSSIVSKKYNTYHFEYIVKPDIIGELVNIIYHYEEPFADTSMLPTWGLMKESKKHFTVALNGDGGDENFAGYPWYQIIQLKSYLSKMPLKNVINRILSYGYMFTHKRDFDTLRKFMSDEDSLSTISPDIASRLYYDFIHYLPDDLLTKVDIASMAHSVEVRSPFLDHEFVELVAKMPIEFKLKKFTSKYILKKIALKYLPEELIRRRKKGFLPPLENWLRGPMKEFMLSELSGKNFLNAGFIKKDQTEKLIHDHIHFRANNTYQLWKLICLKNWLHLWFRT